MGDKSAIEWLAGGATWNPIRARNRETGKAGWFCIHVSDGCTRCYAETMNAWRGTGKAYTAPNLKHVEVFLDTQALDLPMRWRRPRSIFPCSMTDLFGAWVPDAWIDGVFARMALTNGRHTYLVLTKRADRMRAYMRAPDVETRISVLMLLCSQGQPREALSWPLANVRLGVSVENQATADERIPLLLQTPAAVRWVSYEPALGPVDFGFSRWIRLHKPVRSELPFVDAYLPAGVYRAHSNPNGALSVRHDTYDGLLGVKPAEFERLPALDWCVIGGESGPGARPFDLAWARSAIAQCKAAGIPAFCKQLGARPFWRESAPPAGEEPLAFSIQLRDRKGGDWSEWTAGLADLCVREYPR
jgi:protein gp37